MGKIESARRRIFQLLRYLKLEEDRHGITLDYTAQRTGSMKEMHAAEVFAMRDGLEALWDIIKPKEEEKCEHARTILIAMSHDINLPETAYNYVKDWCEKHGAYKKEKNVKREFNAYNHRELNNMIGTFRNVVNSRKKAVLKEGVKL